MTCLRHLFFCFNDTATTEIYTLSLHDALPILELNTKAEGVRSVNGIAALVVQTQRLVYHRRVDHRVWKSTRLNPSHAIISYAVFCLKKKNILDHRHITCTHTRLSAQSPPNSYS